MRSLDSGAYGRRRCATAAPWQEELAVKDVTAEGAGDAEQFPFLLPSNGVPKGSDSLFPMKPKCLCVLCELRGEVLGHGIYRRTVVCHSGVVARAAGGERRYRRGRGGRRAILFSVPVQRVPKGSDGLFPMKTQLPLRPLRAPR